MQPVTDLDKAKVYASHGAVSVLFYGVAWVIVTAIDAIWGCR